MNIKLFRKIAVAISLLILIDLTLTGCKELSNDSDDSQTFSIDLADIKSQLSNNQSSSSDNNVSNSITSSTVKSLVLGAIVVTKRDTPYVSGETLTDAEEDDLAEDALNSANYISIVDLPVADDSIDFLIPPETAGNWQILVVALDFNLDTLGDLDGYESKGSIIYTGFTPNFYTAENIGDEVIEIDMKVYVDN